MSRRISLLTAFLYYFGSHASVVAAPACVLPEGMELVSAAAAPLVRHPLMGCVDPQGALYVGDAAGLNLGKAELEAQRPNRVVKLVDDNGDGVYDRATVFADKMTFPQGACWHQGSLFVASPPGIWKLTDTNGDGVADERRMIVGGFDYTGNAADVHGPFLHPNGRLYWCHGRKGHRVVQEPGGEVVHEGLASGIWSCLPDGADVQWHALGCADNPTEIDFTPQGDIIGTCNLYHSQPRGDTLMHWLPGGVYERPDMMKAIAGLPRTLEHMPVIHNFGHVAVSGCTFYRTGVLFPESRGRLEMLVTHFNTQRIVRMVLEPGGSTYSASEHEFLKIQDPDVHLTDVIEDRDGSLLVLNTGGWFRIGCPSSLMARPDIAGAVYRVRKKAHPKPVQAVAWEASRVPSPPPWEGKDVAAALKGLESDKPIRQRLACEALASHPVDASAAVALDRLLSQDLDPALEHAGIRALAAWMKVRSDDLLAGLVQAFPDDRRQARNLLAIGLLQAGPGQPAELRQRYSAGLVKVASECPDDRPRTLEAALFGLGQMAEAAEDNAAIFQAWLDRDALTKGQEQVLQRTLQNRVTGTQARELLARLLAHSQPSLRQAGLQLAFQSSTLPQDEAIVGPLLARLDEAVAGGASGRDSLPTLLGVVQRLRNPKFNAALERLAADTSLSSTLRLKAMGSMTAPGQAMPEATYTFLAGVAADPVNIPASIEAVRMLAAARLNDSQLSAMLDGVPTLGPLELAEWIKGLRKYSKPEQGQRIVRALSGSPVLGSIEESTFRTLCSDWPPEVYAELQPSVAKAHEVLELKKRRLEALAALVSEKGRPEEGKKHFESGRGTCIACHQVGGTGRAIGPDLSHIGAIRRERDLLESILFPSATLARDYETHAIETRDGQSHMGLIRSHTAEGLLLVDLAGQEKSLAHDSIVAQTTLPTSLMPMGLDMTMSEQELCDLVAWLCSRK